MATINYDFIGQLEGGQQLQGYVPAPDQSNSGVTIATGFDLGARNLADLQSLGISGTLLEQLTPYLGLKKQDAVRALEAMPLKITADDAKVIDRAVKAQSLARLESSYDAAIASSHSPFASLPTQIQTVIASVSFQYGDLATSTPTFWKYVTSQDWGKAIAELKDFGDAYGPRRNLEAQLLAQGLQSGAMNA